MAAPAISSGYPIKLGTRTSVWVVTQSGNNNNGTVTLEVPHPLIACGVQVAGTMAGTVNIQGSNNGTAVALPTAVTFAAAGIKSVAPADLGFRYLHINVTNAVTTNDLTITVVAKASF